MTDRAIWKFPLLVPTGTSYMPMSASILYVDVQDETPTVWAEVDPDAPIEHRIFEVFGTGDPIRSGTGPRKYIGSGISRSGLVWHVYERTERGAYYD